MLAERREAQRTGGVGHGDLRATNWYREGETLRSERGPEVAAAPSEAPPLFVIGTPIQPLLFSAGERKEKAGRAELCVTRLWNCKLLLAFELKRSAANI